MNRLIMGITALYVVLEGVVSFYERTLTTNPYTLSPLFPFEKHGRIWADLLIFSLVNGLVWNHLRFSKKPVAIIFLVCLVITLAMHNLWFATQDISSWLWPEGTAGNCFATMSWAGWMHVLFMAVQLTILVVYVLSPAPAPIILAVAILLTIFWPLGIIQPCWVITGKWIDFQAIVASIVVVSATWGISWLKIFRSGLIE